MSTPPPEQIDRRIRALSKAVYHGASNPTLIRRADRIADDLDAAGHDGLADRMRAALRTRGESLGNRSVRLDGILADFRAARP